MGSAASLVGITGGVHRGDYAAAKDSTKAGSNILLGAEWHDSIEACVRMEIRGFIKEMLEVELSTALGRASYARPSAELQAATIQNSATAPIARKVRPALTRAGSQSGTLRRGPFTILPTVLARAAELIE
jgi:hypothetical protein